MSSPASRPPLTEFLSYRCHNLSRLSLLCLQSNWQYSIPLPSNCAPAIQRRDVHHSQHRHGTRSFPRLGVAHRPAQPHRRSPKAMVVDSLQPDPNAFGICCCRSAIQVRYCRPWPCCTCRRWPPSQRFGQSSCPVSKPRHDRNQHRHGDSSMG